MSMLLGERDSLTDSDDVAECAESAQVPLAADDFLTFRQEQRAGDGPYIAEGQEDDARAVESVETVQDQISAGSSRTLCRRKTYPAVDPMEMRPSRSCTTMLAIIAFSGTPPSFWLTEAMPSFS